MHVLSKMSLTVLNRDIDKQATSDFVCPLTVSKAPLFSLRTKHKSTISESQQTLFALFEKRRERYRRLARPGNGRALQQIISNSGAPQTLGIGHQEQLMVARAVRNRTGSMIVELPKKRSVTSAKCQSPSITTCYLDQSQSEGSVSAVWLQKQHISGPNNLLNNLECTDLAEHVINRAKVRLKRRQKKSLPSLHSDNHHHISQTSSKSHHASSTRTSANRLTIQRQSPKKEMVLTVTSSLQPTRPTSSHSPDQKSILQHKERLQSIAIPHTMLTHHNRVKRSSPYSCQSNANDTVVQQPLKVVYLSEKHSITPSSTGVPNVPPVTPSTSYSGSFKYVLSMSDVKSQRQLKNRLNALSEKQSSSQTKINALAEEKEKQRKKEEVIKLKEQQRAEIYALNKVMSAFEEQKFQEFISGKV